MGIQMDLDFKLLETGSLIIAILATSFTLQVKQESIQNKVQCWSCSMIYFSCSTVWVIFLQDGTSHYMKGFVLLLCYIVIGSCFFVLKAPPLSTYHSHNQKSLFFEIYRSPTRILILWVCDFVYQMKHTVWTQALQLHQRESYRSSSQASICLNFFMLWRWMCCL